MISQKIRTVRKEKYPVAEPVTLQKIVNDECEAQKAKKAKGMGVATDALLWLTRGLIFMYTALSKVMKDQSIELNKAFLEAYDATLSEKHSWITRPPIKVRHLHVKYDWPPLSASPTGRLFSSPFPRGQSSTMCFSRIESPRIWPLAKFILRLRLRRRRRLMLRSAPGFLLSSKSMAVLRECTSLKVWRRSTASEGNAHGTRRSGVNVVVYAIVLNGTLQFFVRFVFKSNSRLLVCFKVGSADARRIIGVTGSHNRPVP